MVLTALVVVTEAACNLGKGDNTLINAIPVMLFNKPRRILSGEGLVIENTTQVSERLTQYLSISLVHCT